MGLSCTSKFAKCFLFVFNAIFWVCGAAILGIGIWILVDENALNLLHVASVDTSDSLVRGAAIALTVVGAVVFITGFLGCCGAMRESPCMLMMFAVIVGFILLIQVVAGIMGAVFKDKIQDELDSSMNLTVTTRYGTDGNEGLTDSYDFMQQEFDCCGAVTGPSDWQNSTWKANNPNETVPITCCVLEKKFVDNPVAVDQALCYAGADNATMPNRGKYINIKGCSTSLIDWVRSHADLIIGVAFGLAAVQVIAILLSCCLRGSIKSQYEYI